MYQHLRLVEAALSTKPNENRGSDDPLHQAEVRELIQRYALFLKHKAYSHQAEYRLVWMSDAANLPAHLDIKVPEVRELCSREGSFEHESLGKPTAMR